MTQRRRTNCVNHCKSHVTKILDNFGNIQRSIQYFVNMEKYGGKVNQNRSTIFVLIKFSLFSHCLPYTFFFFVLIILFMFMSLI